jgi:hypothetical protein
MVEEGWDYSLIYSFDTKRFGLADWGTLTAILKGTYLDRVALQTVPNGKEQNVVGKYGAGFLGQLAGGAFTHNRWYGSLLYDAPPGSALSGLSAGFTVRFAGQYWDNADFTPHFHNRKVREWTTLDCILSYRFLARATPASLDIASDARNNPGRSQKDSAAVSSATYQRFGWRAWLNDTTLTFGVNNLTDEPPPFVAAAFENGYDENTANIRGRTWYVALKKRF